MDASARRSLERDDGFWLSARARTAIWWMLVAFAILDWTRPQVALTQEWWCVLLVLWIVPWESLTLSPSAITRLAKRISSAVLFAWLVSRTEHAVREAVSTWLMFRWSADSELLSYPLHATIAAFVTALVIVIPLRRVVGERISRDTAVLACLPYSLRLAAQFFSLFLKPLAVAFALYAVAIPALAMAAVLWLLQLFRRGRDPDPQDRHARIWLYRILKGHLNPCSAFAIYAATWITTVWLIRSWMAPQEPSGWGDPTSLPYTLAFPALLSALVLASLALWRSLALIGRRNFVTENLSTLTRLVVVLTLFPTMLAGFFLGLPYSGESLSEALQESGGPTWSLTLSDAEDSVRISGEIQSGLGDALEDLLQAYPGIKRLELESPGGHVNEGLALATLVEKYSLDTAVKTHCDSACTLVFVAGRERILESEAELGFHRCRSTLWYYALLYDDENNAKMARYLESKGVSKAFTDKVITVPSEAMWYPSADQLLAAGVMTAVGAPDTERDTLRSP